MQTPADSTPLAQPQELLSPLIHAVLFSLLLFSPFAFGSVQIWGRALIGLHVCVLGFIFCKKNPPEVILPPLWMVASGAGLALFGSVSAFYSPYPAESLRQGVDLLLVVTLFVLVFNYYRHSSHVYALALFLLTCTFAVCFFALLREGFDFWQADRPGFAGPFANHNHFCALLELTVPLALCLFVAEIRGQKQWLHLTFFAVVFILGMFTIVSTLSRAGLISLMFSFLTVALAFIFLGRRKKMAWAMVLTVIFCLGFLVFLAYPSFKRIVTSLIEEGGLKENFRVKIWLITFQMIADSPWFGHGLGSFPFVSFQFRDADIRHHVNYAHNEFLQVFAESGIFTFLLYFLLCLSVIGFFFYRLKFLDRSSKSMALVLGMMIGGLSLFLHSFYDFTLHIPAISVYFVVMLGSILHLVTSRVRIFPQMARWVRFGFMGGFIAMALGCSALAAADLFYWTSRWPGVRLPDRISLLQGAIKINPFVAEYQTDLGLLWVEQKNYAVAKPYFNRALYLNRQWPNLYFYLGAIAEAEGDREKAHTFYEQAIAFDPVEPQKILAYLKFMADGDERDKAFLLCYEASRRNDEVFIPCLKTLAWLDIDFSNLLKLIPNHPVSKIQFGNFLIEQQLWGYLGEYVATFTTDFPLTPSYFRILAVNSKEDGRFEESLSFARQGLKRFPYSDELTLVLGATYEQQTRFDEALKVYKGRHQIEETNDFWIKQILRIWSLTGQDAESEKFLSQLEQKYPRSSRLREARFNFYTQNQRWKEAANHLNEMIRQGFKPDENRLRLARLYHSRQQYSQAIDALEPLYRKDSRNKEVIYLLGTFYMALEKTDEAKAHFETLLRMDSSHASALEKMRQINAR